MKEIKPEKPPEDMMFKLPADLTFVTGWGKSSYQYEPDGTVEGGIGPATVPELASGKKGDYIVFRVGQKYPAIIKR